MLTLVGQKKKGKEKLEKVKGWWRISELGPWVPSQGDGLAGSFFSESSQESLLGTHTEAEAALALCPLEAPAASAAQHLHPHLCSLPVLPSHPLYWTRRWMEQHVLEKQHSISHALMFFFSALGTAIVSFKGKCRQKMHKEKTDGFMV